MVINFNNPNESKKLVIKYRKAKEWNQHTIKEIKKKKYKEPRKTKAKQKKHKVRSYLLGSPFKIFRNIVVQKIVSKKKKK